jgi:hypothetical protein
MGQVVTVRGVAHDSGLIRAAVARALVMPDRGDPSIIFPDA